tara:strand:+ start:91 stop:318 length:228 start_codon:yes stop_codon:yes gene_type:complete
MVGLAGRTGGWHHRRELNVKTIIASGGSSNLYWEITEEEGQFFYIVKAGADVSKHAITRELAEIIIAGPTPLQGS